MGLLIMEVSYSKSGSLLHYSSMLLTDPTQMIALERHNQVIYQVRLQSASNPTKIRLGLSSSRYSSDLGSGMCLKRKCLLTSRFIG